MFAISVPSPSLPPAPWAPGIFPSDAPSAPPAAPRLPVFAFTGETPQPRGRCILVIDDDPQIPLVVREILEDEGYTVLTASDGREALDVIDHAPGPPDLILLDMRMAGMNGWDFAAAYRRRSGPHAPLVTMTAAHDAALWSREIGADGVLPKPFELDDLLNVVERFTSGE